MPDDFAGVRRAAHDVRQAGPSVALVSGTSARDSVLGPRSMPHTPSLPSSVGAVSLDPLWQAFAAGDAIAREHLLLQYMSLVQYEARRLAARIGGTVSVDELASIGALGLIAALDGFDLSRGVAFTTFALPRIRGAMLDELRRIDPLTRVERRRARAVEQAAGVLAQRFGRPATDHEVAAAVGVSPDAVAQWRATAASRHEVSLDELAEAEHGASGAVGELPLAAAVATLPGEATDERLTTEAEVARVVAAMRKLAPVQRQVLALSYLEGLTLAEIGRVLAVTESRVSQIRSRAIRQLRDLLGAARAAA